MNPKLEAELNKAVASLKAGLGQNLYSCCLYGSRVRGNAVEGVSDSNLLIVLNNSDTAAHQAIACALEGLDSIDPFVLAKRGFDRSVRAFAPKFASIQRHYRVLFGSDPLADVKVDESMERFLSEQAVRNLRLRLVYSFITRGRHKQYDAFIVRNVTPLFTQISELLRLHGLSLPVDFEARIPILEKEFKIEGQVLRDLLALKNNPKRFTEAEAIQWHERLFPVVDAALRWIESHWAV